MPSPSRRAMLALPLALAALPAFANGIRVLSPAETLQRVGAGEIVLIDVRRPEEWAATGIAAGAVPIDMRDPAFGTKLDAALGGDRSAPVALICHSGVRSRVVAEAMHRAGFTDVYDVGEGMAGSVLGPGWLRSGLPVERPE